MLGTVQPASWVIEPYEYLGFNEQDEEEASSPGMVAWQPGEETIPEPADVVEEPVTETAEEPIAEVLAPVIKEAQLTEAREQGYEAGLKQGREEGRAEAEAEAHSEIAEQVRRGDQQRQAEFARLAEAFYEARERYLHHAEPEVVRLALAVAARILRREAQIDPLLLTGAVRVALGQIASSSKIHLKVPPADLELWREAIAYLPKLTVRPEVIAGENMRLGDCVIETDLGSVDLGVRSQLSEIERGFFDRPGFRPADPVISETGASAQSEPTA